MFLPKHHLSHQDLILQCEDLRIKYKNIISRLPKKMRKKCKWILTIRIIKYYLILFLIILYLFIFQMSGQELIQQCIHLII